MVDESKFSELVKMSVVFDDGVCPLAKIPCPEGKMDSCDDLMSFYFGGSDCPPFTCSRYVLDVKGDEE